MSSSQDPENDSSKDDSSKYLITDIVIGASILVAAIIVYVARLLYKRRRKRYFKDNSEISMVDMELPLPKKTAADHLEEIKEVTQKIFEPLKMTSPKTSFDNSGFLPTLKERPSLSSTRSSNSSDKKVEQEEGTFSPIKSPKESLIHGSRYSSRFSSKYSSRYSSRYSPKYSSSSRHSSRTGSGTGSKTGSGTGSKIGSAADSAAHSIRDGLPPPPPPSPLDPQDDDSVENEPIQMQLVDLLLSRAFSESSSDSSSHDEPLISSRPKKSKVSSQISVHSEQTFPSSLPSSPSSDPPGLPPPRNRSNPRRPDRNSVHFIIDNKSHSRNKETNDYSNFQPIQYIKPIQNTQSFNKVKTVIEEDDEVIL